MVRHSGYPLLLGEHTPCARYTHGRTLCLYLGMFHGANYVSCRGSRSELVSYVARGDAARFALVLGQCIRLCLCWFGGSCVRFLFMPYLRCELPVVGLHNALWFASLCLCPLVLLFVFSAWCLSFLVRLCIFVGRTNNTLRNAFRLLSFSKLRLVFCGSLLGAVSRPKK